MKKTILHILNTNEFSGAENVVCQIINIFKNDNRYDMVYCSLEGPIREIVQEKKIRFEPIKKMCIAEIKRVIAKIKPTIIHAHDMRASFFVSVSCGSIPFICHIHNNAFDSRSFNLKVLLFQFAANKAKHIFWVSMAAKEGYFYHNCISDKSSVLYNVVDREEIRKKANLNSKRVEYDVIFLGRLSYEKNPLRLISIISSVVKTNHSIKVAIVGRGPLEGEIREKIDELGLEQNIEILGFQSNPYPILYKTKLMIMTSLWEGLPMCALEAIALGIPIVSTPTDGLRELVFDGKTGFLSNDDNDLANKINLICNNDDLRKKMKLAVIKQADKILDVGKYKNELSTYYE